MVIIYKADSENRYKVDMKKYLFIGYSFIKARDSFGSTVYVDLTTFRIKLNKPNPNEYTQNEENVGYVEEKFRKMIIDTMNVLRKPTLSGT